MTEGTRVCVFECVVRVFLRSNLVATASPGKWRLLNTRAKAPSWKREREAEENKVYIDVMKG